jgi:hypothetical protein
VARKAADVPLLVSGGFDHPETGPEDKEK